MNWYIAKSKPSLRYSLIAGVLLLGFWGTIGLYKGINNQPPKEKQTVQQPKEQPKQETEQKPKEETGKVAGEAIGKETVVVGYVIDGDTVGLANGEKVRLIGIDSPESGQPYYTEVKNKLRELVEGKEVLLEKDVGDRDKYGRLVRYIWLGTTLINLEMVKQGYSKSYTYPPDVKYQTQILAAEKEAREKQLGLWGAISTQPKASTGQCPIKGNISRKGEKIYHIPGGAFYDKTVIDESRGERWFCSEGEAQVAGWRKSKR